MRVVLYGFDVFAFDDGVVVVLAILWSRSCGYVGYILLSGTDVLHRREALAHC
jgi:hypothetical protein